MTFVRHACCHFVCDMIAPLTIRRVWAQFVQRSARYIVNGLQKFGVVVLEVVHVGDASTDAVDARCVQYAVDRVTRARMASCMIARNTRSSTKDIAYSTRVRICAVAGAYVETDVAQASVRMIESIAVLSVRGLGAMADGVRQGVLVAWCCVNSRTNTD